MTRQLQFYFLLLYFTASLAQKPYTSTNSEILFTFSDVQKNNKQLPVYPRLTVFYHFGEYLNWDGKKTGFLTGFEIRNLGLITREDSLKIKRRAYTIGLPIAIKLGNLNDNLYFIAGGEYELLFHYKEKIFNSHTKTLNHEWFSNQVNRFLPSAFIGIQLSNDISIKLRFYLQNFISNNYKTSDNRHPEYNRSRITGLSISKTMRTKKILKPKEEGQFVRL